MNIPKDLIISPLCSECKVFDEIYNIGRKDERKEWEEAAGSLLMKYADDIHTALPEQVEQIKIDTIKSCIDRLEEYKEELMTDSYVIDECIEVLKKMKH